MTKKSVELPNLNNATPGFCVDELGEAKKQIKYWKAREAIFKEALSARRGKLTEIKGERFEASITPGSKTTISMDAVKEKLGEDWCDENSTTTAFDTVRIKEKKVIDETVNNG